VETLREVGFYDHWEEAFRAVFFRRSSSSCSCRLPGGIRIHLRPNSDPDARGSVTDANAASQSIAYAHSHTHANAHTGSDPADQH
jgi:hypothetical protein